MERKMIAVCIKSSRVICRIYVQEEELCIIKLAACNDTGISFREA